MPFNLYPKQKQAIESCTARINLLEGSVRSGKTHGSYEWWARFLLHNAPDGDLLMTGKTLKSLERNIILPLQEFIPVDYSLHSKRASILGKTVHLEGANDKTSESKIRGMTIAGHYGDEVTLWPESYFKMALSRMSVRGAKFIGTTNPDSPNHWLKSDWIDEDKGVITQKLTIDDNPHLPEEFVSSIKKEYTGLWYKRFIEGRWVVAEGAVYDMFNEEKHVVSETPKPVRYWLSGDYGTATTTVFLLFGQSRDGRIYVLDEFVWDAKKKGHQLTDSEQADKLEGFIGGVKHEGFYCDPSAVSFMLTCSKRNIRTIPANNDVLDGIRNVSTLLANDLLYIHEKCTYLISDIHSYVWDDKQQEKGKDKPLKQKDHACLHGDSIIETKEGKKKIKYISTDDKVLTRDGYKQVLRKECTGVKEIFELSVGDRKLYLTEDHPIYTLNRGFIPSLELLRSDIICILNLWKNEYTKAYHSGDTRNQITYPTAGTSNPPIAQRLMERTISTGQFGLSIMEIYQKAIISTTKTVIQRIMESRISKCLLPKSMRNSMNQLLAKSAKRNVKSGLQRSDQKQVSGINQKREGNGIKSMQKSTISANSLMENQNAKCVEKSLRNKQVLTNSVQTNANQNIEETTGLMISNQPAKTVENPLAITNTTTAHFVQGAVLRSTGQKAKVYNIEVDGKHEYFANGILTHNCDAWRYGCRSTRGYWKHLIN